MADQGADANVMSSSIAEKLEKASPNFSVKPLERVHSFKNALTSVRPLNCDRVAHADVLLRVRHGTKLVLKNMKKWMVTGEDLDCVYIGRHCLATLG